MIALQEAGVLSDHCIAAAWTAFAADRGEESFQAFHESCAPLIFSVCVSVLRNQDDAMDAMQLVYVELFEAAFDSARQDELADVCAFVRRVSGRISDSMLKRKQRAAARYTDPVLLTMVPDFQRPVYESLSSQEIKEMMVRHLGELPDRQRLPVTLHYFHGMSHQQISEALGRPRLTITRDIDRGVNALRSKMEASGVKDAVMVLSLVLTGAQLISPPASAAAPVLSTLGAGTLPAAGAGGAVAAAVAAVKSKAGIIAAAAACLLVGGALVVSVNRAKDRPAGTAPPATLASFAPSVQSAATPPPMAKVGVAPGAQTVQQAGSARPAATIPAAPSATGSVTGRIISRYDKAPLPGVPLTLTATPKGGATVVKSTVSSSDGLFVFSGTPRPERLSISVEPAQPWLGEQRRTLVRKDETADVGVIQLGQLGTIRGRIVDCDQRVTGVSGKRVELRSAFTQGTAASRKPMTRVGSSFPDCRFHSTRLFVRMLGRLFTE